MLPRLKVFIALVLFGCAAAAYADPPGRVGRLNYAAGAVSFASAEAPGDWMQAVANHPLTSGDRLWVERDARAEFHVGSIAVRLAGHTAADVLDLDDDRLRLRLAEGTLNIRVRELDRDDVVEIATAAGAVQLREPGSYRLSVDSRQDVARITVHFGRAEVITPGRSFDVPSSQVAVIAAGSLPSFEVAAHAAPDEFDRWSAERDRREDRTVSTKYVSREMTGYEDLDDHGSWRTVPEYGHVWVPSRVPEGWAPYRHGHWKWISPWGWTWIDDAPWGFAPSHYGRWVWLDRHWAWAPGPIVRRPVYAPALVAFVGGSGWSFSASRGPAVGWFPLGWREPFIPWYRASSRHVHNVNVTHVTHVTTNVTYVNRSRPEAVTVVPQQAFVSSRPAWRERHRVGREDLARAQVIRDRPPAERASLGSQRRGQRPPAELYGRDAVVTPSGVFAGENRVLGTRPRAEADPSRVRVVPTERDDLTSGRSVRRSTEGRADRVQQEPSTSTQAAGDLAQDRERERRAQREAAERARSQQQQPPADLSGRNRDSVRRPPDHAEHREREHRDRRSQQEAAERPFDAQRQQQSQPTRSPSTQIQSQTPRVQPPPAQLPQVQQPPRSQPQQAQQPQTQAQASRGQPPQARSQSTHDGNPGRRTVQRPNRDRD
jgi:hypothetical protein